MQSAKLQTIEPDAELDPRALVALLLACEVLLVWIEERRALVLQNLAQRRSEVTGNGPGG